MLKSSYRTYKKICEIIIELIRQFYTEERCFRVVLPNGATEYRNVSSDMLLPMNAAGIIREPIFDVSVTAQKSSPFSRVAQNEMAQALYNSGAFNPERIDESLIMLSMMDFEGKDLVIEKLNTEKSLQKQVEMFNSALTQLVQNPATAQIALTAIQQAQMMQQLTSENSQVQTTQGMVQSNMAKSGQNLNNYKTAVNGAMNQYSTPYANKLAEKTIVDTTKDNNDNNFIR